MINEKVKLGWLFILALTLPMGCAYNPLAPNNHLTGSPVNAAIGAGAGAGSVALINGPKPLIPLVGLGGGMLGYYVTTLRYASGGIIRGGGQVYQVGDMIGIVLPSDELFEPNTCEFLPRAYPVLESVVNVLERYPRHNIMISGNTSGFYHARWERQLSESRAKRIAAYLWSSGISDFVEGTDDMRKLRYVGYGDYFPIANDITNYGIRANSRMQITAYPAAATIRRNPRQADIEGRSLSYIASASPNICDHCAEMDA